MDQLDNILKPDDHGMIKRLSLGQSVLELISMFQIIPILAGMKHGNNSEHEIEIHVHVSRRKKF